MLKPSLPWPSTSAKLCGALHVCLPKSVVAVESSLELRRKAHTSNPPKSFFLWLKTPELMQLSGFFGPKQVLLSLRTRQLDVGDLTRTFHIRAWDQILPAVRLEG